MSKIIEQSDHINAKLDRDIGNISRDKGNHLATQQSNPTKTRNQIQYPQLDKLQSSDCMSLLKQIEDKGAVLEWSPVAQHANLVALGTKV